MKKKLLRSLAIAMTTVLLTSTPGTLNVLAETTDINAVELPQQSIDDVQQDNTDESIDAQQDNTDESIDAQQGDDIPNYFDDDQSAKGDGNQDAPREYPSSWDFYIMDPDSSNEDSIYYIDKQHEDVPNGYNPTLNKGKLSAFVTDANNYTEITPGTKDNPSIKTLFFDDSTFIKVGKYDTQNGWKYDRFAPEYEIGRTYKFHTSAQNSYYKIRVLNVDIPALNVNMIFYDKNFEQLNIKNNKYENSTSSMVESQSVNPIIKLNPNQDYYFTIYINSNDLDKHGIGSGEVKVELSEIPDNAKDDIHEATDLTLNTTYKGNLEGYYDTDWFRITVPNTNGFVKLTMVNQNIASSTKFTTLETNLNEISSDYASSGGSSTNTLKVNPNQKLYIKVENSLGYDADDVSKYGDYTISAIYKADDHPDTVQTAKVIKVGEVAKGTLQAKEDTDVFKFNTGKSAAYFITVNNTSQYGNAEFKVLDINGRQLASNSLSGGTVLKSQLQADILQPNTEYYLTLTGDEDVAYTVIIEPISHKITYKLNGGKNHSNNKNSFYESISQKLYNPTRKGYVFLGWTLEESSDSSMSNYFSDEKKYATSIGSKETSDVTATANWSKKLAVSAPKVTACTAKSKTSIKIKFDKVKCKVIDPTIKSSEYKSNVVSTSNAKGYEVRYSIKKNMKKAKVVKLSEKKNSTLVKKLKKNKKYYFQVRAYTLDSTGEKVYSSWSKKVSVKTKGAPKKVTKK